jgi:GNAT superfamily N-acetyltransferase
MSEPLHFRRATTLDAPLIVPLVESAYRGEGSKVGWTTEADLLGGQRTDLADVLHTLAQPNSHIILAWRGAALVATAHIQLHDDGCHFGMFAVSPTLQGSGTGKALIAECERRAVHEFGAQQMRMWVLWVRDSLIAFYERRGYALNGEREAFPYGDARFGLPKRSDLYFVVLAKTLAAPAT